MSQIYSKDSFDRFGDDLCQYLLSFLSFCDTFRCECVSKQFKRLVFNTLTELNREIISDIFDKYWCDLTAFELILKKCPNIQYINLNYRINNSMFSLIIKHCNHLNAIYIHYYFNASVEMIEKFFAKKKVQRSIEASPRQHPQKLLMPFDRWAPQTTFIIMTIQSNMSLLR